MNINDRVHRYLDGELDRKSLTSEERAAARRFERWADELRADLADAESAPAGGIARRVMAEIAGRPAHSTASSARAPAAEANPAGSPASTIAWLFGKRRVSFSLRPVSGLAALLLVGAGLVFGLLPLIGNSAADAPADEPTVFVRFELAAPEASQVQLAGSFSNWSPNISLRRTDDGRWTALVPLRPGVHDYAFRIDGERWVVDPYSPRVADGFGGYNSRLSLVVADS